MKLASLLLFFIFLAPTALGAITTYSYDPITDYRVYPTTNLPDSLISDEILIRSCPGEFTAATFVVKTDAALNSFLPIPSNLVCNASTIDSSNVDIKIVKCWYQRGDFTQGPDGWRMFLPELLINDNDLVHVTYIDMSHGSNYLRTSNGYVSINAMGEGGEYDTVLDSPTLLPLTIAANENQQYWITMYIPPEATSGLYNGVISLKESGIEIGQIQLSVEVLPFTLPDSPIIFPKSRPTRPLDMSIYYNSRKYDNIPALGTYGRSEEQLHAEFRDLKNHGITNPNTGCQSYYNNPANVIRYLQIRQEEGLLFDTIYYTADYLSNGNFDTVDEVNMRIPEIKTLFEGFGAQEVYIYCNDEADVTPFANLILATHALGVKTMVAQDGAEALAAANYIDPATGLNHPLLNMAVCGGMPIPSVTNYYHNKNLLMGNYGNPQGGAEKPLLYRQNYGIMLWQYNIDEAGTYAYCNGNYLQGYRNNWNDWNWEGTSDYKIHTFIYPTSNGLVDTTEWEGFREGVNDLRYVAKLEQSILDAKKHGINTNAAENYLTDLKKTSNPISERDLAVVRNDLIEFILDPGKDSTGGEFGFAFTILIVIAVILAIWFAPPLVPIKSKIQKIIKR